jgi:hypothetical protein
VLCAESQVLKGQYRGRRSLKGIYAGASSARAGLPCTAQSGGPFMLRVCMAWTTTMPESECTVRSEPCFPPQLWQTRLLQVTQRLVATSLALEHSNWIGTGSFTARGYSGYWGGSGCQCDCGET